jgi:hypothetical protein
MLTDAELTSMRATVDATLPDVCDVLRPVSTSDGRGGSVETWTPIYESVACRKSPVGFTDEERVVASRIRDAAGWTVTLTAGTRVRGKDVIEVGGVRLEVVSTLSERSWEVSSRVVCKELA